jgi:hypothetical protein
MDLLLSERGRPTFWGEDIAGIRSSADGARSSVYFKDLTLFDRGKSETLPGETRGALPVFDRVSDALVGVSNEVGRPLFGRGSVDGLDAPLSSSSVGARPAGTPPNIDFLLFAGASFSSLSESAEKLANTFCGLELADG